MIDDEGTGDVSTEYLINALFIRLPVNEDITDAMIVLGKTDDVFCISSKVQNIPWRPWKYG